MSTDSNISNVSGLNRRTFLKIAATSTASSFALAGVTPALAQEPELQQFIQTQLTHRRSLQSGDIVAIQQLNSLYFFALDALVKDDLADNAAIWAATFTPTGTFSLVQNGQILLQATGTAELISIYLTFPDVYTTRHWCNNLLIEPRLEGAKSSCYIIAMNIGNLPATITRSGIYRDELVKTRDDWKYQNRELILDPNSPAG